MHVHRTTATLRMNTMLVIHVLFTCDSFRLKIGIRVIIVRYDWLQMTLFRVNGVTGLVGTTTALGVRFGRVFIC